MKGCQFSRTTICLCLVLAGQDISREGMFGKKSCLGTFSNCHIFYITSSLCVMIKSPNSGDFKMNLSHSGCLNF